MDILNITFNIEKSIIKEWSSFMGKVFIPYSNVQENFSGHNLLQVMVEDPNAYTYSYQLYATEEAHIDTFMKEIFPALIREMKQLFGDKVLTFHTKLREVKMTGME